MATLEVIPPEIASRFWAKVDKSGDCWLWTAGRATNGYGQFYVPSAKANRGAHRVAYMLTVGPILDGTEVDHLCRVRHCVNPAHLEPVTHLENVHRGGCVSLWEARRAQTHCKWGHEFTPENTYRPPSTGRRMCRKCNARRALEHYYRNRAST